MKKIIVCANAYPPNFIGGAELIAHYQAKTLQRKGHSVIVFAGDHAGKYPRYFMNYDEYDGLPVFRVSLAPQDYSADLLNFFHPTVDQHFAVVLDRFRPDVVHMHNIIGLSTGLIRVAKEKGAKTVLTVHDHWGFCYKNTLIKGPNEICTDFGRCAECMSTIHDEFGNEFPIRMRKDMMALDLSNVDAFISPSDYLAGAYIRAGVPIGKMNTIWYGIDVNRYSGLKKTPSTKTRFTFIGYLGAHKGVSVLLDAVELMPSLDSFVLNFAGSGDLEDHLRSRVKSPKLQHVVSFLGKVDNSQIDDVFRKTDILILPSVWPENQPVTITEAMAARTPVIASAIGGIPELIIDGYNGYLVQPGSASHLAEKMYAFVLHPELVRTFGENGFRLIEQHTFERQVEKICAVYE